MHTDWLALSSLLLPQIYSCYIFFWHQTLHGSIVIWISDIKLTKLTKTIKLEQHCPTRLGQYYSHIFYDHQPCAHALQGISNKIKLKYELRHIDQKPQEYNCLQRIYSNTNMFSAQKFPQVQDKPPSQPTHFQNVLAMLILIFSYLYIFINF